MQELPLMVNKEVETVSSRTQQLLNSNFCPYVIGKYDWDCINTFNGVATRGILGTVFYIRDIMDGFITLLDS